MPVDLNAVAQMARDSADKEGVMTSFDLLLVGKERVRIDIPPDKRTHTHQTRGVR